LKVAEVSFTIYRKSGAAHCHLSCRNVQLIGRHWRFVIVGLSMPP